MNINNKQNSENEEEDDDIKIIVHEDQESDSLSHSKIRKKYIITSVNQLSDFIKVVLELRELVKCSLCLDVMKKPIEISCSHCFCEDCLSRFLEEYLDKPTCPVCRNVINKRSRKPNQSLLGYIDFINDVNKELKGCFDCEVMDLGNKEKLNEMFGEENTQKRKQRKRVASTSSICDIIPATIQSNRTPKRSKATNKHSTRKGAKQKAQKPTPLHTFADDENRNSIIHWLNDNKNKFDTITQTQQSVYSKCSQESVGMPSVSQIKKMKALPLAHPQIRHRSSSVEHDNEISSSVARIRCNTWPCEGADQVEGPVTTQHMVRLLEEMQTTVALKQKEEEFLDAIESELKLQECSRRVEPAKSSNSSKMRRETGQVIKKMEGQAPSGKNTEKTGDCNITVLQPVVLLENMKIAESSSQKSYDLDVVEAYFNENLTKIVNKGAGVSGDSPEFRKPITRANSARSNEKFEEPKKTIVPENKKTAGLAGEDDRGCSVQSSKELIAKFQNSISKMQLESNTKRVSQNCRLMKHYATKIQNILESIQSGAEQNGECDFQFSPLPDVCLPQSAKKYDTANVETQTELVVVDVEVQAQNEFPSPSTAVSESSNESLVTKLIAKYGKSVNSGNNFSGENLQSEFGKKSFQASRNGSQALSDSFNRLNFDTQDLLNDQRNGSQVLSTKRKLNVTKDKQHSQIFATSKNPDDVLEITETRSGSSKSRKSVQKSGMSSDFGRKRANKRLNFSEGEKKKFKRIRTPSDSDSDTEVQEKKRNKYLQEDISVQFDSEAPVAAPKNPNVEEFKLSDDDFLDKILAKCNKDSTEVANLPQDNSCMSEQQKNGIIEGCGKIRKGVEDRQIKPIQASLSPAVIDEFNNFSSMDSFSRRLGKAKNVFSSEEAFNDDGILQMIDRAIEESKKTEKRRIIGEQRSFSESVFGYSSSHKYTNGNLNDVQNKDVLDLDDSFNEEIALLEPEVTVLEKKKCGIKVLQNIAVVQRKVMENAPTSKKIADSDDEIFSDVDIVETTPTKSGTVQNDLHGRNSEFAFDKVDEYYCPQDPLTNVDMILPPPPEFQEENGKNVTLPDKPDTDQDIIEKTLTEHMKVASATPNFLSPPRLNSQTIVNKMSVMGTSTPISGKAHSQKTLSISPIGFERDKNIFEAAKKVKSSPLTVVRNPSHKIERREHSFARQQQSILSYVKPASQESRKNVQDVTSGKPCVTCSRLGRDHMIAVSALANKKLVNYTATFGPDVTHVVVAVNEKNCVKDHTIKYVFAVAAGIWVVSLEWVQACLAQNRIVTEEPYEVRDVSGIDGPRQARLTRTKNPLLKGFKVFAAAPFLSTTQADVENVVKLLGGKVASKPDALLQKDGCICIIIAEASATQDFEIYESWLEALRVITVEIEWLSRSVGQYKVLSLRPFALCSEELLDNLGYPEELVANIPFSGSQSV